MKKINAILLFLSMRILACAQTDTTWKKGGGAVLNFNQIGLSNWAAGGESALATSLLSNFYANYKFKKVTWDNTLNLNYGLITANNYDDIRKNDDKIELNSKYGQFAFDNFYYSALLNFLSQFTKGYDYTVNDSTPISNFLSPGYVLAAVGLDWKPNNQFSLFISPATGKFTFVTDQDIADKGLYGNIPAVTDSLGNIITPGETFRAEFGASLIASLTTNLTENISEIGKLTLFDNYTSPVTSNRDNVDVDFVNTLNIKANKFLSASLFIELIYDHDILIPTYETINGIKTQTGAGPKTQLKEVIGIGLSYNFGNRQ